MEWLANNESSLSAIAAIIAIIAGLAVVTRLTWARMPSQLMSQVKRPAFLSDWRNLALIGLVIFGVTLLSILTLSNSSSSKITATPLPTITGKPSMAVLPLDYIAEDQSKAFIADAIAEDVITLLSRNPHFLVVARNSSFTYRGRSVDIRQVGEELGARYVVEGSVRSIKDRVRVSIQLIEAATGLHVWADQYDRPFQEIFALQDEITNGIAAALGDEIFKAELNRTGQVLPKNLDVWGLVFRAQNAYLMYGEDSSTTAQQLLREALEMEPEYPLALARLARLHAEKVVDMWGGDPESDIENANKLADKALQLAPSDALVMQTAGFTYCQTGRQSQAIDLLRRVTQIDPDNAETLAWLGFVLTSNESTRTEALTLIERSIELSPKAPFLWIFEMFNGLALFHLERYEESEQMFVRSIAQHRGYHFQWIFLAAAQAAQGNTGGATASIHEAIKTHPSATLGDYRVASKLWPDRGVNWMPYVEALWPGENIPAGNQN